MDKISKNNKTKNINGAFIALFISLASIALSINKITLFLTTLFSSPTELFDKFEFVDILYVSFFFALFLYFTPFNGLCFLLAKKERTCT